MARPLRLQFTGAVYHVTSRGNARQKVFFNDADRELFLRTLSDVVSRYRWICHGYCSEAYAGEYAGENDVLALENTVRSEENTESAET
jgi:hypothetical protein